MRIESEDLKDYVGKKIRFENWDKEEYVILTAVGETRILANHPSADYEMVYDIGGSTCNRWETYEEPKQKVKKWQALYERDGVHYSTEQFYISDEEARFNFMRPVNFIKLLPHTEIEVDL